MITARLLTIVGFALVVVLANLTPEVTPLHTAISSYSCEQWYIGATEASELDIQPGWYELCSDYDAAILAEPAWQVAPDGSCEYHYEDGSVTHHPDTDCTR